jgi:hypothetical protein
MFYHQFIDYQFKVFIFKNFKCFNILKKAFFSLHKNYFCAALRLNDGLGLELKKQNS